MNEIAVPPFHFFNLFFYHLLGKLDKKRLSPCKKYQLHSQPYHCSFWNLWRTATENYCTAVSTNYWCQSYPSIFAPKANFLHSCQELNLQSGECPFLRQFGRFCCMSWTWCTSPELPLRSTRRRMRWWGSWDSSAAAHTPYTPAGCPTATSPSTHCGNINKTV